MDRIRAVRVCGYAMLTLLLTGCAYGLLYEDITEPLTIHMEKTAIMPYSAQGRTILVKEPVTQAGVRAEWSSYGIGDVARNAGFCTADYADLRTQTILGGVWKSTKVIVHGCRPGSEGCTCPLLEP